jgi:3-oxoacyl-[acyl-carrier-protein] synthase-3
MPHPPQSVVVESVGAYLPAKIVTNADWERRVDTSDEWIITRTGIRERRIATPDEASSDMAIRASQIALERGAIDPETIDLLIVSTITPDSACPATCVFVQEALGLKNVLAFDLNMACSGFLYALEVGRQMTMSGQYRRTLIIGAEKLSTLTNEEDRSTCVLFGDGAGAAILKGSDRPDVGLMSAIVDVDGRYARAIYVSAGGSRQPITVEELKNRRHFLAMNGKETFKLSVRCMEKALLDVLDRHCIPIDRIDCIVPHQANARIIETLAERLNIGIDRFYINIDRVGNTSSASIPIALAEAVECGRIAPGHTVAFVAFGAGLAWGASLLKYGV